MDIERLQRVINGEVMLAALAVHFSILAEMPSLPTDLVVSKLMRRSKMTSSVQSYCSSSGQSLLIKCSKLQTDTCTLDYKVGKS